MAICCVAGSLAVAISSFSFMGFHRFTFFAFNFNGIAHFGKGVIIHRCYSLKKKTRSKKTCCFYTTSFYITNYRILVLLAPTISYTPKIAVGCPTAICISRFYSNEEMSAQCNCPFFVSTTVISRRKSHQQRMSTSSGGQ